MRCADAWLKTHHIPVRISSPAWWWMLLCTPGWRVGRFKKRVKDSYNPRRWGGHILGLEIGSRG